MSTITALHFLAKLIPAPDEAPPAEVELQFKISHLDTWETLLTESVKDGVFRAVYTIPERLSTKLTGLRAFREVIQQGGLPALRLAHRAEGEQKVAVYHVFATVGELKQEKDRYLFQFNTVWLLPRATWEKQDRMKSGQTYRRLVSQLMPPVQTNDDVQGAMEELKRKVRLMEKESQEHAKRLSREQAARAQLQVEYNNLLASGSGESDPAMEEELVTLRQDNERLMSEMKEMEATVSASRETAKQLEAAQAQVLSLAQQLAKGSASADEQAEMEQLKAALKETQEQMSVVHEQKEAVEKEKEEWAVEKGALEATILENVKQIDTLNQALAQQQQENRQQQEAMAAAVAEKEQLQQNLDDMQAANEQSEQPAKAIAANKVYSNVLKEIQTAKELSTNTGFKLANISLDIKTLVEQDETGIRFQTVDLKNAANISSDVVSSIKLEVVDGDVTTKPKASGGGIPNVIGLTETACRKRLQAANLRLRPVYEHAPSKTLGQAFEQSPKAGTPLFNQQEVTVIFAKDIQN